MHRWLLIIALWAVTAQGHYERKNWPHWLDYDHDCQNTRAEILIANSEGPTAGKCIISSGRWYDPYTDKIYESANKLDIDHIVPLQHAYYHGAANWTTAQKAKFANDPFNLIAVERGSNRAKGAKSPDEWMPPNKKFGCVYVQRWMSVKLLYGLSMSAKETAFISSFVTKCHIIR